MIRAALAVLCLPGLASADALRAVPYDSLRSQSHRIENFDSLPATPEPGIALTHHWRAAGLSIGEHLAGQAVVETATEHGRFDTLNGPPDAPLRVVPGPSGRNLTIAHHDGFGSNALFPLGPLGIADADGRGEGSVAIRFDTPQFAVGIRLHAEYADPLGQRPRPGTARITVYDDTAHPIAAFVLPLSHGVIPLGWRSTTGMAAMTIENSDPGGIALDDILYDIADLSG